MPKLVFKLSDKQSLDFPLAGEQVRLGRNAANDIVIDNSWISSYHAEFRVGPGGETEVRDLNSSNGTLVNGKRIETSRLSPGDTVCFGQLEAVFDPPGESAGLNGVPSKALTPAAAPILAAPLKGPRAETPSVSESEKTQPVSPLPRPALTEPIPSSGPPKRIVVPAPAQATALIPASEGTLADSRRELQQAHLQLTAARSEIKLLTGTLEVLRRDQETEEQNRAKSRSQGEQEARELQDKLKKLKEELGKTESTVAESARDRSAKAGEEEKEITARLATLKSSEQAAIAAIRAQEEKLAALRNEESGLTSVSIQLKTALQEVESAVQRKLTALSEADAAETRVAAVKEEYVRLQAQVTDASAALKAREVELVASNAKLEDSQREAGISAATLAETQKALAEVSGNHEKVTAGLTAGEAKLAEQNLILKAAGEKLKELNAATAKLSEIETAIEEAAARALTAKAAVTGEETKAAGLLKAVAASGEELKQQQAALAKVTGEFAALQSKHEAVAASLHQVTGTLEATTASVKETEARLSSMEISVAAASERLAALKTETSASETLLAERRTLVGEGETDLAALTKKLDEARSELSRGESAVAALNQQKSSLDAQVASLSTRAAQLASGQASLTELEARLSGANEEMARKQAALAQLEMRTAAAESSAKRALESHSEATRSLEEVRAAIARMEERKQTFADAPDPTWGTVHVMAKGIIKQVDLLDDLLAHLTAGNSSREVIAQLTIFRAGLRDILTEFTVEPYHFEPGLSVDIASRKKIQIVESREDSGKGTRILKSYRPGYVCTNGSLGMQTLLRKAEVSVVIGR
jgi:chromosome segregation ATPase